MVNEPYQIKDYDHGEVDAFYTCLKEGKLSSRGQVLVSTDRYELESFNDNIAFKLNIGFSFN